MFFDFRTTKKQKYILWLIIKNKSLPIARLRRYFYHRARLEAFLTDMSEIEGVVKNDDQMVWLNPAWVAEQETFFKKKVEKKK